MKKILVVVLALCMICAFVASCATKEQPASPTGTSSTKPSSGPATWFEPSGPRTTAERADAPAGDPISPPGIYFPGLENPGAVPKKQYFIAYAEGEMGDNFTRTLFNDVNGTAQKYVERFGIRWEYTISGNNSTQQLQDIQSLIAKKPDLLIINPNEAEPLDIVVDWAYEAGIPIIMFDKEVVTQPGNKSLISVITYDMFEQGVQVGVALVDYFTEKYGAPKGDVVEIAGILGAVASIHRSQGMNLVFADYPDINVVASVDGEWDNAISYNVSQDILSAFPPGTIDAIVGNCDESSFAFMEAAGAVGRLEEFGAGFAGMDSPVLALEYILDGRYTATAENGPYHGMNVLEYAIQFLNGVKIPERVWIPNRFYRVTNDEQRKALEEVIQKCKAGEFEFVPASLGYFDKFPARPPAVEKIYPVPIAEDPARYANVPYYKVTPSTIRK